MLNKEFELDKRSN